MSITRAQDQNVTNVGEVYCKLKNISMLYISIMLKLPEKNATVDEIITFSKNMRKIISRKPLQDKSRSKYF